MVSLHRHSSGRSPFFFAKFRGADGQVVIKSTKQTDRSLAMTVALELERASGVARQGQATETQFRKVLAELLEKTTSETLRCPTLKEFLDGWLKGKELAKSEGTHIRYGGTVKLFPSGLGQRVNVSVANISARDMERFRDAQLKAGKAKSSVNVDLKTLRTAFNTAWRQGLIPNNPVGAPTAGTNVSVLTLTNVQTNQSGNYSVQVFNGYGSATSSDAALNVVVFPPSIVLQPSNQNPLLGGRVTFTVSVTGRVPLHYQWLFNGEAIPGATNSAFTIPPLVSLMRGIIQSWCQTHREA